MINCKTLDANNVNPLPEFRVIVLTRDRPLLCESALISVLNQTHPATEVIVSDNSSSGELTRVTLDRYRNVKYVRQSGTLTAPEHMIVASKLVSKGYYNLLHDDDELAPEYIQEVRKCIIEHPNAMAIGTGYVELTSKEIRTLSGITRTRHYTVLTAPDSLLLGYTSPIYGGMPAFSSYTYNSRRVDWNEVQKYTAGNYYDTLFLASLLAAGSIIILNTPLFRVGVHDNRISLRCGVRDYKIFYRTALCFSNNARLRASLEVYRLRSFVNILLRERRLFRLTKRNIKVFIICARLLVSNIYFRRTFIAYFKRRLRGIKIQGDTIEY